MRAWQKTNWIWIFICGVLTFTFIHVFTARAQEAEQSPGISTGQVLLDSLLQKFSVEEMARFKEFYQNEIRLLEKEKKLYRGKGIEDGQKIYAIKPDGEFMDKVLFRLAEFYFTREQDDLFKRMEKHEEEFSEYEQGKRADAPEEPKPDYSKVLQTYLTIMEKFPHCSFMDDVLYHLAFTYEKNLDAEKSLEYYQQVVEKFPNSQIVPEALIRIAEYYFDPSHRDLDQAIYYYDRVAQFKNTPRYDEALYKLGWCYYLQEKYDQSIETYYLLVQDIDNNAKLDPFNEYTNPSLKDEALEYIGICFHDAGGLPQALAFIDAMNRPQHGTAILTKLGDVYRENEEKYGEAMLTYMALLERYPYFAKAPDVQEKIVKCARKLEDDHEIYMAQQQLFDKYHPGSDWYLHISQKVADPLEKQTILNEAYKKSEFALRDNINLSIRLGDGVQDQRYYQMAVESSREYLQTFPTDTSAYTIHWNMAVLMDTKLNQKEEAFKAYLDICNNYIQDKFKKYAAQNAIVLAREMAPALTDSSLEQMAMVDSDSLNDGGANSAAEARVVEAYNNFIKHFPHEEQTAIVLGNAGNIYYKNKDFNNALKYFNTLLRRFPESPSSKQALLTAMESYFGKRDFSNTELVAKNIRSRDDLPAGFKEKAEKRLAESIYLHAESLAGEDKHLEAAVEFKRVVQEVPDALFADKALFQAGIQFDAAKDFNQAIESYRQLMARFPKSEHYLDAVNNLALDYAELKEFALAAQTYETLSSSHPDSSKAQDALFNASYFYVKAEDWRNSIRVNRQYVERYPNASDAEDMFYNMAEYYLKLDDIDHANEIYGEFATKYPESPRTVETYFKRGEYFKNKGNTEAAFREFDLALAKNQELKSKGLPANDFYAAEALFAKSGEQYKQYAAIHFNRADFDQAQKTKKEMLQQLVEQYQKVVGFATIRIYESMYKIGSLYENFAQTWTGQQLPSLSENEKIVFMNNLNQTSAKLYERAFDSYKTSYKAMTKLADAYQPTAPDTSDKNSLRVTAKDTTLQVANRWINKAGAKISEMLYLTADLTSGSIENFLNAPLPAGLDEVSALEYRNQVLAKAIFPVVQENAAAHLRNLNEADSLQLVNPWVEKSQQKLSEVMNILPVQYRQLSLDAFNTYMNKFQEYKNTMTSGTQEQKENAIDLAGKLVNIINLGKNYALLMIANYKASIDQLMQNENGQIIAQSLFSECINTTAELAGNFQNAAKESRNMKDQFTVMNQNDPQMVYEDAIYTFSDGQTYLHDNALAICETGYKLKQQYDFPAPNFAKLASLLVELSPETYAKEFNLDANEVKFVADSSWLMITTPPDSGWTLPDFPLSNWKKAIVQVDSTGKNPVIVGHAAMPVDSIPGDSVKQAHGDSLAIAPVIPKSYFLRKEIFLDDVPLAASLFINADDNVWVYLNGIEIFKEDAPDIGWGSVFETDLTSLIKNGKNTLAIKVQDSDQSGNGIQPVLELKTIFKEKLAQNERKLLQKELSEIGISDLNELIFNRYMVPE